ncbi:hypothetical protein [Pseudomonas cannabina]|uniref:Uncharacterized protein n=1 Tax=Pseudomonas cannabina TaxID=86840 RepID=A0A0P9M225_PSECA|nr:hypothetical protein [Pseudomonas cannabina]KAA8704136.1 hypothetical protein F4W70_23145 [Pseudomonas cannabina]KPW61541.1 hypothetical protein ALO81_200153 [Pseudomonas cannabina]SDR54789.1 hypothetical protein SAMN05216597_5751 [Pseudomonas cannabina]
MKQLEDLACQQSEAKRLILALSPNLMLDIEQYRIARNEALACNDDNNLPLLEELSQRWQTEAMNLARWLSAQFPGDERTAE